MRHVYILVFEDAVLSSVAASIDILSRTNQILQLAGHAPAFDVKLVSEQHKNILLNEPAQFYCQFTLRDISPSTDGHRQDLIVIPAFSNIWDVVYEKNKITVEWLQRQYAGGSEIASLCVGSYFLAQAGLLNGKTCTSHWKAVDDMRGRFPTIHIEPDTVITDQNGIYTGGGAFSSLNLLLYLVEKFCGHAIGVMVSKNFSIHRDHTSQAHFSVFKGLNQHGDKPILRAQEFIEQQYANDVGIDYLAELANMSKRNFVRRFKHATQQTPLEYIQRVRVEAAKKALENGRDNIQVLVHEVGYNDVKTFRDVFKRYTGVTPQAYRAKYGRLTHGTY